MFSNAKYHNILLTFVQYYPQVHIYTTQTIHLFNRAVTEVSQPEPGVLCLIYEAGDAGRANIVPTFTAVGVLFAYSLPSQSHAKICLLLPVLCLGGNLRANPFSWDVFFTIFARVGLCGHVMIISHFSIFIFTLNVSKVILLSYNDPKKIKILFSR